MMMWMAFRACRLPQTVDNRPRNMLAQNSNGRCAPKTCLTVPIHAIGIARFEQRDMACGADLFHVFLVSRKSIFHAGEAGDLLAVYVHGFGEHGQWAYPQTVVAVAGAVDDQFFFGFGVTGDADDFVVVAFVMAVQAGLEGAHRRIVARF